MKYTAEQDQFLREAIPGRHWQEIVALFKERFGIELSKNQVCGKKRSLGVNSGVTGREKGCATPMSERYQIGDEMESRGNVWVKVAKGGSTGKSRSLYKSGLWEKKQNVVWERANGCPLPSGYVVMFIDNDRRNFDTANLIAVPIEISQAIYGMKIPHSDPQTMQACITMAQIRLALKRKGKQ